MVCVPAASKPSLPGSLCVGDFSAKKFYMISVLTISVGQNVPSVCQRRKPKCCTEVAVTMAKGSSAPDPRGGGGGG